MVSLAEDEDVRLSTNPSFLEILEEFRTLEDGIYIRRNGIGERLKIRLILHIVVGDNLALNEILGFVRTFSSSGFCRVCVMLKEDTQNTPTENENLIRNEQNYLPGRNGIKEFCILNFLNHYMVY